MKSATRLARALRAGGRRPGAVVIGGDFQGLGIVRSLGRRGITTLVIDDELSISRYSRFATAAIRVPELRDRQTVIETLLEIGQLYGLEGWVLYPTRDETVEALSRGREALLSQFRVPTPPWDVAKWALDKRHTYALAARLGIAIPRTWLFDSSAGLRKVDGTPPFAVKPAVKEDFFYATGRKAWRADTHEELEARFRDAAALVGASKVIVQELIPGSGGSQFSYCAFFRDGGPSASMVVRRLRQHPLLFGRCSTYVETTEHTELERISERLLRSMGYYGLVEVEYKYDKRDGQTKLLDVNARTWASHSLGQRAGVDFPYLLFADQLSLPAPDGLRAPSGVSWIRLATDVPTAVLELTRGTLDWRTYAHSLGTFNTESVFSRDDPAPGLAELALLPYLAVRRGF